MTDCSEQGSKDVWQQRWHEAGEDERISWLGKRMFRAKKKALAQALAPLQVNRVLEVGCGLGYTLGYYQQLGYDCLGIDIVEESIAVCKAKGLPARLQAIDQVDDSFELVSSDGMLEHFLNFEPYAQQMMAASSRYVLLIQPNYCSFTGQTLAYLANLLRGHVNVYEFNYRLQDFSQVFARNGFGLVNSLPVFFNVFRLLLFERQQDESG